MDIPKVTGTICFDVSVACPHCDGELELNSYPYTEEEENDTLGMVMFGSPTVPAQWDGFRITYECNHCKQLFVLTRLQY